MIEEVINHCMEEKEQVYVTNMDISEAFDTMGIIAMLFSCIIIRVFVVKPGDSLEIGILTWQSLCA